MTPIEPAVPAGHTTQLLGALLGTNGGHLLPQYEFRVTIVVA